MAIGVKLIGTAGDDRLDGTIDNDVLKGREGDDRLRGKEGSDRLAGEEGFDVLFGNNGDDLLYGGADNDFLFGGFANDILFGDNGKFTVKGSDLSSDSLSGGNGEDRLFAGDGNDTLAGGVGADTFYFRWNDPSVELAAGTGRAFANIVDFNAADDTLRFDAAGVGADRGGNFIGARGAAATFFSGAAAQSDGEAVMVITDQRFATGADAVLAAQNESEGDFIIYFNTTVQAASLLYVDGTDTAHSIARFTNIDTLRELRRADFSAEDFIFV